MGNATLQPPSAAFLQRRQLLLHRTRLRIKRRAAQQQPEMHRRRVKHPLRSLCHHLKLPHGQSVLHQYS